MQPVNFTYRYADLCSSISRSPTLCEVLHLEVTWWWPIIYQITVLDQLLVPIQELTSLACVWVRVDAATSPQHTYLLQSWALFLVGIHTQVSAISGNRCMGRREVCSIWLLPASHDHRGICRPHCNHNLDSSKGHFINYGVPRERVCLASLRYGALFPCLSWQ